MVPGGDRRIYNVGHDSAGRCAYAVVDPSGAARIHREFRAWSSGAFRMTYFARSMTIDWRRRYQSAGQELLHLLHHLGENHLRRLRRIDRLHPAHLGEPHLNVAEVGVAD